MSDLDARKLGMRFEPVAASQASSEKTGPPAWHLVLGVYLPLLTIGVELVSRMCAEAFFDPIPSWAHVLAIALVPVVNLLLWRQLAGAAQGEVPSRGTLRASALAAGASIAISGFYTLVFLPLAPIALIAVVIGIGLLPLSPLMAFASSLKLWRLLRQRHRAERLGRYAAVGLCAGILALLVLDIPQAATRLGVDWAASSEPERRERGVALLRWLGDDDLLLRMCYDTTGRPTGLLSGLVLLRHAVMLEPPQRLVTLTTAEVREVYYRVHGVAFNAKPAPFATGRRSLAGGLQWDADHGGTSVGGRVEGLEIVSSRMDGVVRPDEATAYIEWVVAFRNASPLDREARMQVMLPPGGVVSRATLWVNGEEREAAYGGRGEVRAAYERVAVQQRRDPLLVTTKGADRVLAQAFPVPRNGGTIKFKLGMTAPLELLSESKARLVLPAITSRNFSFGSELRHGLWIESRRALATRTTGLHASSIEPRLHRVQGEITDEDLGRQRGVIEVERDPASTTHLARFGEEASISQRIAPVARDAAGPLLIVLDGSARVKSVAEAVVAALDTVPQGAMVGLMVADETVRRLAIAPWSSERKQMAVAIVRSTGFTGGKDNTPALAEALIALEGHPLARLLWIHGPQPVAFRGGAARLEQASARLKRLPQVHLYETEPGSNEALPDQAWAWGAVTAPRLGGVPQDLAAAIAQGLGGGPGLAAQRAQSSAAGDATGSDHIARLWAKDRVLELMRQGAQADRKAAAALASSHRLVTPVSGAVVLETRQQYDESRLTPVEASSVPAVPEPHEWALIILALASLAWMAYRRCHMIGAV